MDKFPLFSFNLRVNLEKDKVAYKTCAKKHDIIFQQTHGLRFDADRSMYYEKSLRISGLNDK